MADVKKNALAELAERLIGWSDWFKDQRGTMMEHDILKAQRIVAELAKTNPDRWPMCVQAIIDCREIAAEGSGDGK